jgi:hypothetical protein
LTAAYNSSSVVPCVFGSGESLPTEPFPTNGRLSGSALSPFRYHITIGKMTLTVNNVLEGIQLFFRLINGAVSTVDIRLHTRVELAGKMIMSGD